MQRYGYSCNPPYFCLFFCMKITFFYFYPQNVCEHKQLFMVCNIFLELIFA